MDDCKIGCANDEKSLMKSLELLEVQASNFDSLADFGDEVLSKLNNPKVLITQGVENEMCNNGVKSPKEPVRDLIDLFNEVSSKLEAAYNRIGRNTEQIKNIIG